MQPLSARSRLIVTSFLLCLAVAATIFCAVQTVQAIQRFQLAHSQIIQRDVNAIQPWMTIHYISRVYGVPEEYLAHSIGLTNSRQWTNVPLRSLSVHYNRPVDALIRELQAAIKAYQKLHPYLIGYLPKILPLLERSDL